MPIAHTFVAAITYTRHSGLWLYRQYIYVIFKETSFFALRRRRAPR